VHYRKFGFREACNIDVCHFKKQPKQLICASCDIQRDILDLTSRSLQYQSLAIVDFDIKFKAIQLKFTKGNFMNLSMNLIHYITGLTFKKSPDRTSTIELT
jgi:hypothetical protein